MVPIDFSKYEEIIRQGQTERAILFVDLVGSTAYKQMVPDHKWIPRQLAFLNETYKAVLAEHSAILDYYAFIGDEILFSISEPARILEILDCVDRAIGQLNEVFHADLDKLQIKVGAHTGNLYLDTNRNNNPLGNTIDIAARVAKEATTGQILLSQMAVERAIGRPVAELSGPAMDRFVPYGIRQFKGVEGEMLIFRLANTLEPIPDAVPEEIVTTETGHLQQVLLEIIRREARMNSVVKLTLGVLKEESLFRRFFRRVRSSDETAMMLLLWSLKERGEIEIVQINNGEITIQA